MCEHNEVHQSHDQTLAVSKHGAQQARRDPPPGDHTPRTATRMMCSQARVCRQAHPGWCRYIATGRLLANAQSLHTDSYADKPKHLHAHRPSAKKDGVANSRVADHAPIKTGKRASQPVCSRSPHQQQSACIHSDVKYIGSYTSH